jgi:hypothetical protein
MHGRLKHVELQQHFTLELIQLSKIRVQWCTGDDKLADIMAAIKHKKVFKQLLSQENQ